MSIRTRAKDNLPTVLLTLISIVQALALELLWSKIEASGNLIVWSFGSIATWLQVSATFTGIALIWLIYANNIMRFRWVPDTVDSLAPLLIGMLQFSLISQIGPTSLGHWLLVLSLVFGVMTVISMRTLRNARSDPDNHGFFSSRGQTTWRDFLAPISVALVLCVSGLTLIVSGYRGVASLGIALFALLCVLWQLVRTHQIWLSSTDLANETA